MKISYNWLREFLPVEVSPEELARHLFLLGFEVSELRSLGAAFSGVVVGEILDIQKHPNADRLSLCSVNDGKEKLAVVCGAKNIAVGQRVPLARVGAKLPGGRTIERSKIRGAESFGMLCSAAELGLAEVNGGGIHILPPETPVGADAAGLLANNDHVLDVEISPNRPDCLSHYGLARELSIYFLRDVRPLPASAPVAKDPASPVQVRLEDKEGSARYVGRSFTGLHVGPSPGWLVQRLEAVGLRPINAVVDITNYVLLELGHPLHAFDTDTLQGGRVSVRRAKDGEKLLALDGKEYALAASDLVIADGAGPVAIAGIMGGAATGVTEKTKNVFLEAAHFTQSAVRRTSQRLRLRSDSSYRFERGLSPETAAAASARAAQLIHELCGAPAEQATVDVYPEPPEAPVIHVTVERINKTLGTSFKEEKVQGLLEAMSARLSSSDRALAFVPPPHRRDLRTPWDLAEEIGRHLGYDAIGSDAAPVRLQRPKSLPQADTAAALRRRLAALGFFEAYNYDFLSPKELTRSGLDPAASPAVLNPLSEDWAHLRPSLLPGLFRSAAYNFRRGVRGLRLFELGKTYSRSGDEVTERSKAAALIAGAFPALPDWLSKPAAHDGERHFFEAKGALTEVLRGVPGVSWRPLEKPNPFFHPKASLEAYTQKGHLATASLVPPALAQAWDLPAGAAVFVADLDALAAVAPAAPRATPLSPFPSIARDLSLSVPEGTPYAKIAECLHGLPALTSVELLDRLAGDAARAVGLPAGRLSLTLRLTFGLPDRTLRDEEAQQSVQQALDALARACGAALRG